MLRFVQPYVMWRRVCTGNGSERMETRNCEILFERK